MAHRSFGRQSSNGCGAIPHRKVETLEDWERVIRAAASYDDDHVVGDLRERFDEVVRSLEQVAGWKAHPVQRPVQIMGSLDGVDTGIRQLRRSQPLEIETVVSAEGLIRIPSLPEMLRIKAWLVVTRNATRDYVDTAALATHLKKIEGHGAAVAALSTLDALYPQENGESVMRRLAKQLCDPLPYDFEQDAFEELRGLQEPWTSWDNVATALAELAVDIEIARSGA